VPAIPTPLLQANQSARYIELVVKDNQSLGRQFMKRHKAPQGLPAAVHKLHGLHNPNVMGANTRATEFYSLTSPPTHGSSNPICEKKSVIVASVGVLRTGITEAGDHRDVGHRTPSTFADHPPTETFTRWMVSLLRIAKTEMG
jgi:hypothetical protein